MCAARRKSSVSLSEDPKSGHPAVSIAQVTEGMRAAVGAVTTTTVSVLPVFLTGALAVQISAELGFDPAGLGLVVALYFGISALASLPCGWLVERFGSGPTSRTAVTGAALVMGAVAAF